MSLEQLLAWAHRLSAQASRAGARVGPPGAGSERPRSAALSPEEWASLFAERPPPARDAAPPA